MAYSELVKRFDRVRDYMRDFLIFGFKTREDFGQKSARTYDNERLSLTAVPQAQLLLPAVRRCLDLVPPPEEGRQVIC